MRCTDPAFRALVRRGLVVWLYQPVYADDGAYREALKLPAARGAPISTIEMSKGDPGYWLERGLP